MNIYLVNVIRFNWPVKIQAKLVICDIVVALKEYLFHLPNPRNVRKK